MRCCLPLLTLICFILSTWCCDPNDTDQNKNGCKIIENTCVCKYGCRFEYIYNTRRECSKALRAIQAIATAPPQLSERSNNICSTLPCLRGHCLQTSNEPGFTCKCDSTGFYGRRCEKACPTLPSRDMVFPHECVII